MPAAHTGYLNAFFCQLNKRQAFYLECLCSVLERPFSAGMAPLSLVVHQLRDWHNTISEANRLSR